MHRDFKGVWIPKEFYLNTELGWTEKIMLVEIFSLQGEDGCFASNDHFAEFLQIGTGRVANLMTKLKDAGWLVVEGYGTKRRLFVEVSRFRDELSLKSEKVSRKSERLSRKSETSIYRNINTEINTNTNLTILGELHSPRPKKGTRLPPDFEVTGEMVEWADGRGLRVDLATETEKFRNYWAAVAGAKGIKLDWVATWRNWMLNAEQYRSNAKTGSNATKSTNLERLAGYEAMFAKYAADPDA